MKLAVCLVSFGFFISLCLLCLYYYVSTLGPLESTKGNVSSKVDNDHANESTAYQSNTTTLTTFVLLKRNETVNNVSSIYARYKNNVRNKWISVKTKRQYSEATKNANNRLIITVFYYDWCQYFKKITPYLDALAEKYPDVIMIKVNIDKFRFLAKRFEITHSPTFVFRLKNSQQREKLEGSDLDRFNEVFNRQLALNEQR